ncbi:hypothetical protein PR202_gb19088 [Eleusine coracana subsp. coracana]|uniref:Major facilitator superfamily (MFS) profile domain-containing protein n=1 Tax=Eleusine coracana subsp. coracana TaxID=191504 RepID=A0AAV5F7B2_ELECO|nr:hypothetical protein PR202_gb19088 [Eleusine coracana subsp. coracana]
MGGGTAGRQRQWTLALVTVAALLESADQALLPAVYREVGAALGASPTALGSITLCRVLIMAVSYPLATCAAARHDRARVVAAGAFLWSVATVLVGVSGTFLQMAIARGFNGVGLALVLPAIFSLVADYSDDATRGAAFGWVQMAQCLGYVLGRSLGLLLAPTTFLGVIPGWRLAFHALALVSLLLAALTWLLAADPRPRSIITKATSGPPWAAFDFVAMWLELEGFTHWETTLLTNLSSLANALGSLFAGFVGDPLARRFPNAGRVALARRFPNGPTASGTSAAADRKNADALGKAVFAEIAVPVTICCLTYSALYWTYPEDRRRAQMDALQAEAEEQDGDCESTSSVATVDGYKVDCRMNRAYNYNFKSRIPGVTGIQKNQGEETNMLR